MTVDQSEQNNINCSAEGYPPPEIFLSYNGNPANATVTLEILSAAETDEGEYCCNASNVLGRFNASCLSLQVPVQKLPVIGGAIFGSLVGILLIIGGMVL